MLILDLNYLQGINSSSFEVSVSRQTDSLDSRVSGNPLPTPVKSLAGFVSIKLDLAYKFCFFFNWLLNVSSFFNNLFVFVCMSRDFRLQVILE